MHVFLMSLVMAATFAATVSFAVDEREAARRTTAVIVVGAN